MKTKLNLLVAGMFLAATSSALATVRYVNVNSANPTPPYTTWATAATDIQAAVDAAGAGDEIVVTNGTYAGGTWVDPYGYLNCVVVDTPLTLQSVNGPDLTVINGGGAVRCLYLTGDAVMVGFTLTNGSIGGGDGGGVYCESTNAVVTNCVLSGNSAWDGGGAFGGTLNNCTLTGNSAEYGGGAADCTLDNCALSGNSAGGGGGALGCTLNNCTLTGNSALYGGDGGGAVDCTLNNCTLTGNSAWSGGGAYGGTVNNCTLTGNSAWSGGGAADATLNNCALTENSATEFGAGAYSDSLKPCTLNNCTLTGNSASDDGGGAYSCSLNNCIVYFNSDPNRGNYDLSCTLNYCCATPMPTNGVGNISADPQLASATYLSAQSPCIGAGSATYASGTDIDGDAWANPPSIGCDEYHAGAVTGPLTVSLTATYTNVATGFPVGLTAFIAGRTDLSVWDFGDGYVQVNEPYTSHTWAAQGDYLVALWAFSDSYPGGVSATVTIYIDEGVHYVVANSGNPVAPYTSWATAATNIQDAVDVVGAGATIFVTNGTYAAGGRTTPATGDGVTNRVAVDKPLTVRSVNGPEVTVIQGQMPGATNGYMRCVYLTNAATLMGFTLTNGVAGNGGGVWCESTSAVLSNCMLTGNSAGVPGDGGGAYGGTLNNCTLTGNSAHYGGGAYGGTLNNCTLTGNTAGDGGGAYGGTLNNCILYFNSAADGPNYDASDMLYYCCTMPMPTYGVDNITNAPLFVNYAGGNLHLQSNSPCINSGNNAYVVGSTDLDGNPRIVGGTVDIGAYEYQTPVSMISYAWLQQFGLPINTSTDTADLDGTGMNVYQDWIAGLNPTNALSVLQMTSATPANNPPGLVVTWESVSGIMYFLQSSTNLAAQPAFITIQSNIVGQAGTTSYTDTTATNAGPYFYRVGVGKSAFTLVDVTTTSVQAVPNTGYLADSASQVTITLPSSPALGDIVWVSGVGTGGWELAQNAGQSVATENIEAIGAVWTQTSAPSGVYTSIASSSDGTKLVAAMGWGGVYTSSDSGATWTLTSVPPGTYSYVASSSDGTRLVAANRSGGIYTSSDSGATWVVTSAPGTDWQGVASSADGTKLVAVVYGSGRSDGSIWVSSNSGSTWSQTSAPAANWMAVASSADGTKLVAAINQSFEGGIYTSSDSGGTWTQSTAPAAGWISVASSSDGTKLVAAANGGVYTSSDSGATWTLTSAPNAFWWAVASSADGSKLITVGGSTSVPGFPRWSVMSMSLNSGATWIGTSAPVSEYNVWQSVASSSDGAHLVAGNAGGIYTSHPTAVQSTTVGIDGAIIGGQYDAIELQYVGNGTFTVLSHQGYLKVQ